MPKKLTVQLKNKRLGEREEYANGQRVTGGDGVFACEIEVLDEDTGETLHRERFEHVLDFTEVDTAQIQAMLDKRKAALLQRTANRGKLDLDLLS